MGEAPHPLTELLAYLYPGPLRHALGQLQPERHLPGPLALGVLG